MIFDVLIFRCFRRFSKSFALKCNIDLIATKTMTSFSIVQTLVNVKLLVCASIEKSMKKLLNLMKHMIVFCFYKKSIKTIYFFIYQTNQRRIWTKWHDFYSMNTISSASKWRFDVIFIDWNEAEKKASRWLKNVINAFMMIKLCD